MLIIISSETFIANEAEQITQLFENGMSIFHLRKPSAEKAEMAELLKQIPAQYHAQIVVHSHYDLMNSFGLKGIHITSETKDLFDMLTFVEEDKDDRENLVKDMFEEMIAGKTVSISCHSLDEMNQLSYAFDYYFLSPIFDSISKEGYKAAFDLERISASVAISSKTIIALGGITPENAGLCIEKGFNGVAVIGSIWNAKNSEQAVAALKELQAVVS